MAGISFTIGGVAFSALTSAATARQALFMRAGPLRADITRYKPKGVSGNFIVRGGDTGAQIKCRLRYAGTVAEVYAAFEANKAAWYNTAVTIAGPGAAENYYRCQLEAMDIISDPRATGRAGLAETTMDVEATFQADGGITAP